ncbi:MAG: methyl-accepting chemotaxis protein [Candidatus Omnitrophica bacterium]|nr:methyl-accepting chemotaxis protein [Candidatus Omnitrophota bacterium]
MEKRIKRRIYFIEKSFQAKFIMKFCGLVALGGLLTIGLLYLWAARATTVSIVNSRVVVTNTANFILPLLIQTVIIATVAVAIATICVTLFVSHKIAGPLYRFKKIMEALGEGDFLNQVKIRNGDQFQDLAKIFDNMIAKNRAKIKALKADLSIFKEKLGNISENEIPEHKRAYLNELKRISSEIDQLMGYFKA